MTKVEKLRRDKTIWQSYIRDIDKDGDEMISLDEFKDAINGYIDKVWKDVYESKVVGKKNGTELKEDKPFAIDDSEEE